MSCRICDHTMQAVGDGAFWCPRCGTIRIGRSVEAPKLVMRARELAKTCNFEMPRQAVDLNQQKKLADDVMECCWH